MLQLRPFLMSALAVATLSALAPAQTIPLLARLNGLQETPPLVVPGNGLGLVAVDTAALTLSYREIYQNLTSAENAAHIHGFSGLGVPSGVVHVQPLGALKCGTWNFAPAQLPPILAGQTYFNVHTVLNGGGELRGQIALAPDQSTFCYGDGTGTPCPCGNNSAVGDNEGCLHQAGMGGRLVGYVGSTAGCSISNDTLVLHALRLPTSTFILFFQGTAPAAGGLGIPFGNGLLCMGGALTRMNVKGTCVGMAGLPEPGDLPISTLGAVVPGTFFYQGWFRTVPPFCTTTNQNFNLTNGVRVNWVP
jgi:hypothetical protein